MPALDYNELSRTEPAEPSAEIRSRVIAARAFAAARTEGALTCNGLMTPADIRRFCRMDDAGGRLMQTAYDKFALSARAYDRILKVARTAADFDKSEIIRKEHIGLALQLRSMSKKYWQ